MPNGQQNYEEASIGAMFDFSFKRFITLSVIKVLYVLGLILIALAWLIFVIGAFARGGALGGFVGLIFITITALLKVIFLRVWLELIVVIFRIGENTSKLVEAQGRTPAGEEEPGAPGAQEV